MRIRSTSINWRNALGEVCLIVLGILIALGIDSYVERRAGRKQGLEHLAELRAELQIESQRLLRRASQVAGITESATRTLRALQGEQQEPDLGAALLQSLAGDGIARESVVWTELINTGDLRLIEDARLRSAIITHFLDRETNLRTIEQNFSPAVRDLRATAWDIMPVEAFPRFFAEGSPGVSSEFVLEGLRSRSNAEFLLKRVITTSAVARRNLEEIAASAQALLERIN